MGRRRVDEIFVENGDIRLRVEVDGDGPVLLFVHGWPELPYSWRHQMSYFAECGYRVAAMEVRGYGQSSAPSDPVRYNLAELSDDVASVAAALDKEPVVLIGHDWGGPIVWTTSIRHPDRVRAVAGLSVTYTPPTGSDLLSLLDRFYDGRFFYMLHFQEPGIIEAEFATDMRSSLKRVFHAGSGAAPINSFLPDSQRDSKFLSLLPEPPGGPLEFLTDDDLDVYASAFIQTGLTGAFNRYRAMRYDAAALKDVQGQKVRHPACFIAGERDMVRAIVPGFDAYAAAGAGCTDFRGTTIIEGAGHWVQQEAPEEVNAALGAFFDGL